MDGNRDGTGRSGCLRWTWEPAWRATYQPKSRKRTWRACFPVIRGALGIRNLQWIGIGGNSSDHPQVTPHVGRPTPRRGNRSLGRRKSTPGELTSVRQQACLGAQAGDSVSRSSRLRSRSQFLAVRKALFDMATRKGERAEDRKRAQRIVAELRAALQAGGFRPHLDIRGDWTRTASRANAPRPCNHGGQVE